MDIPLRYAATALALVAGAGTGHAQTVYVQDRYPYETVVTQPLATPIERTTTYRTIEPQGQGRAPIVRERIVTERYAPGSVVRERVVPPAPVVEAYAYAPGYRYPSGYAYAPGYSAASTYTYVPNAVPNAYAYSPPVATVIAPPAPRAQWVYETDVVVRDVAYCRQRYRSYDPVSRTFLGFDGLRHSCP